jgi:PTH1 family peptidyl-tRNA hydrolase
MLVDRVAERAGQEFQKISRRLSACQTRLSGQEVALVKPRTFMNLSGAAALEALRHFSVSPDLLLVVYDDIALPLGRIRLRRSGTSGGHRGMQSIIDMIGGLDIQRLRIGVGAEDLPDDFPDYVLSDFTKADLKVLDEALDRACDAVYCWVTDGIEAAMARFNG